MLERIVSGGQTGVDRAALDFALENNISCGGWCPKGRKAEDGVINDRYPLTETASADYSERTRKNVLDSDGTLICTIGDLTGGTLFTFQVAQKCRRPVVVCRLDEYDLAGEADSARVWISKEHIRILNIAGPRGSKHARIYKMTRKFLGEVFHSHDAVYS